MSMHTRQPSIPFAPADKNQTISSSTSSSAMICSYPIYSAASGASTSGSWPPSQRQPYNGVDPLVCQDQQRARWQAQQGPSLRRERRLECASVSPVTSSLHSHHGSHAEVPNSPYSNPSQLLRASGYDGMYTRPVSADVQSPVASWNTWEMDASSAASPPNHYQKFSDEQAWNNHLNLDISHLDSQNYDSMLLSGSESSSSSALYTPSNEQAIPLNGFSFPHRLSPDVPSPSPSPVYAHHPRNPSSSSGVTSNGTRRNSEARPEPGKESGKSCSHCRATTTPLWRRDPSTMKPLCNACGLYLQQRNKLRPQELIDADDDGSSSEESDPNYSGPECSHCRTHHTSVWRRSKAGDQLCNACGVYARLRGKPRPLTLKKHKIRPRSKHSPK